MDTTTTSIVVEAAGAAARARAYTVTTNEHYEAAGSELVTIKGIAKRMEALRSFLKEPILEAGRRVDDLFRDPREQLEQAESAIKSAMATFSREQKRLADEASRRAHEQLVEQRRLEAELEAARKAAEVPAEAAPEDDFDDFAPEPVTVAALEEKLAEFAPVPEVILPPVAKGVHSRTTWKARVVDLPALVRAAVDGDAVAMSLLSVNESLLSSMAKTHKRSLSIPGIEAYEVETLTARAR